VKLIFKRIRPAFIATAKFDDGERDVTQLAPFALYTEDGEVLPCQISTCMLSEPNSLVRLTVVFEVNGRDLIVEGDV
jgi:hypothetical protein